MEWGWGVTIFLCDLSLPTGTLSFSPKRRGPKKFEPSQSSAQSKVFYRSHLGQSGGTWGAVCAWMG